MTPRDAVAEARRVRRLAFEQRQQMERAARRAGREAARALPLYRVGWASGPEDGCVVAASTIQHAVWYAMREHAIPPLDGISVEDLDGTLSSDMEPF
jgi:hypothetical protein